MSVRSTVSELHFMDVVILVFIKFKLVASSLVFGNWPMCNIKILSYPKKLKHYIKAFFIYYAEDIKSYIMEERPLAFGNKKKNKPFSNREGGDIGLLITLVPKVL